MVRGRRREQWWHTAELKAALFEPHRDEKRRSTPFSAREFHPFYQQIETVRTKTRQEVTDDIRTLAAMFNAKKK